MGCSSCSGGTPWGTGSLSGVMETDGLVNLLESYRGRDRLVRTLCYGCQLVGGSLEQQSGHKQVCGRRLLTVAAQLSHCRTVLRLFDDFAMFSFTKEYGLGKKERDPVVRWISVFTNLVDQLYYPCEHVAWAADAEIIHTKSDKWWTLSTALWGFSLFLGILRSLRVLYVLRRKNRKKERFGSLSLYQDSSVYSQGLERESFQLSPKEVHIQMKSECLAIISNLADLSNAIHWMPPGILWAGCFPQWLVGLMGTVSSLVGIYKTKVDAIQGCP